MRGIIQFPDNEILHKICSLIRAKYFIPLHSYMYQEGSLSMVGKPKSYRPVAAEGSWWLRGRCYSSEIEGGSCV